MRKTGWRIFRTTVFMSAVLLMTGCPQNKMQKEVHHETVISNLTVNYRENPLGIEGSPIFAWQMISEEKDLTQSAYEIRVAYSEEELEKNHVIWDSGKVQSSFSVGIEYEGEELQSETAYVWQVSVWNQDEQEYISDIGTFETGMESADWDSAKWISAPMLNDQTGLISSGEEYLISFEIQMDHAVAGLTWGNETNRYGEYYLWGFDCSGDQVTLVTERRKKDEILWQERQTLQDIEKDHFIQNKHQVLIQVNGEKTETYLDGSPVKTAILPQVTEAGRLGTYVDRGAFYAYFDHILVTGSDGTVLLEEEFDNPDNMFSPLYTKTEDGRLRASSGLLMMPGGDEPAPMLRNEFNIREGLREARLYISALGCFEASINGLDISNEYFAPGTSNYDKTIYYKIYDISDFLTVGQNAIGIELGHYRYDRARSDWGDRLGVIAKIKLVFEDGTEETIVTDENWKTYSDGPVRQDDLFWGEYYDAEKEPEGWNRPGFDMTGWSNAEILDTPNAEMLLCERPPVVCLQELTAVSMTEPVPNVFVYDFGQNFSGFCKINMNQSKGTVVTIRYAEMTNDEELLNKDDEIGTVWTENLFTAQNTDYFVSSGEEIVYEPDFVCRGFRYVQISGTDTPIDVKDITALVLSSDNKKTGYFECSDEELNRIYEAIYWTQISNYVDIPTDCPQRDERLAWTGDAQVFSKTASFNSDIHQFMLSFLRSMRDGQNSDGSFQDMAYSSFGSGGNNGWGDAGIIVTWNLYQQYGDVTVIREHLDEMCKYVDYLAEHSENGHRDTGGGYRDHLAVDSPETGYTDTVQSAYCAYLLSKMCEVVSEDTLAEHYQQLYEIYQKSWQEYYMGEDGSIGSWLQSEYALAIMCGMYPDELVQSGADRLNITVTAGDYHPTTGYISTPYLLQALSKYGYQETAYRLLQQKSYPSWQHMFLHNGTSITEGWATVKDEENGQYSVYGSRNHYALGSIGAWFYEGILGIHMEEEDAGWKHFVLEPKLGGGLTYASGSYQTMYGKIESGWRIEGDEVIYDFVIPANTSATIKLTDNCDEDYELGSGRYQVIIKR